MRNLSTSLVLFLSACAWISSDDFDNHRDRDGDKFISEQYGGDDCDDQNPEIHPDATDIPYDGVDSDCDDSPEYDQDLDGERAYAHGGIDCDDSDPNVIDDVIWYPDDDDDGYGDKDAPLKQCVAPPGYIRTGEDCDDSNFDIRPGATESCDGIDNDCDGVIDPEDSEGSTTFYPDEDADLFGSDEPTTWRYACEAPTDQDFAYLEVAGDCNDALDWVNPNIEVETCNDFEDNDCDGRPGTCELGGFGYIQPPLISFSTGAKQQTIANELISPYRLKSNDRADGQFGTWVGGIGDVNGDDRDDILITAPYLTTTAENGGKLFFFMGRTKEEGGLALNPTNRWAPDETVSTREMSDGDLIYEGHIVDGRIGGSASPLGDINADGYDDFAVSECGRAADSDGSDPSRVLLFNGATDFFDTTPTVWSVTGLSGAYASEAIHYHCAIAIGTTKKEAFLAISSPNKDHNQPGQWSNLRGAVYILNGSLSDKVDADNNIDVSEHAVTIEPDGPKLSSSVLGRQIATGDFDGDGEDDLFISDTEGVENSNLKIGSVHVAYEGGGLIRDASPGDTVMLTDFDAIFTGNRPRSYAGTSLVSGDMNGDGRDDIVIGAPGFDGTRGTVYVVLSETATYRNTWFLDLAGNRLDGTDPGDYVGVSIALIPAANPEEGFHGLNGDDKADLWIGSGGPPETEVTYLVSGENALANNRLNSIAKGLFPLAQTEISYPPGTAEYTGRSITNSAGDVNNDGYVDLIVGFPWRDPNGEELHREGIAAIFLGGGL